MSRPQPAACGDFENGILLARHESSGEPLLRASEASVGLDGCLSQQALWLRGSMEMRFC